MKRLVAVSLALSMSIAVAPSYAGTQPKKPPPSANASSAKKAQELFKKGIELFEKGQYSDALAQFRASHAEVASPNSHLYIARALAQLNQLKDAWTEYQKVIEESEARAKAEPRFVQTRDQAKAELADVSKKIAVFSISVTNADETTTVKLNNVVVPREQWGKSDVVAVGPGELLVDSRAKGPMKLAIIFNAGDNKQLSYDVLAPPAGATPLASSATMTATVAPTSAPSSSKGPSGLRIGAYVAGGVGVIGLALFAIEGLHASSTYSDLKDACGSGPCSADQQSKIDGGKSAQTIANVGLVLGIVGLGAGTTMFILSSKKKTESALTHGPTITDVGIGAGAFDLRGTF